MEPRHGDATPLLPTQETAGQKQTSFFTPSGPAGPTALRGTFTGPDRFGKMLKGLPPLLVSDRALELLGAAMEDNDVNAKPDRTEDPAGDNPGVPAGYTYFGQFVDHDITFDKTEGFPANMVPPEELQNGRTPTLELDSMYGLGPWQQPELYDPHFPPEEARFRIGRTSAAPSPDQTGAPLPTSLPFDLPREDPDPLDAEKTLAAVIGDPRNDENLLVAQTHLLFLRFHNKVVGDLLSGALKPVPGSEALTPFEQARLIVRWHYQWLVLNDFIGNRIIQRNILDQVLKNGRQFYRPEDSPEEDGGEQLANSKLPAGVAAAEMAGRPFMPVEHSVAAYRMGHSMIRQQYDYNRVFRPGGLTPASLDLLFHFTGNPTNDLRKFEPPQPVPRGAPIPSNWIIDWRRFFDFEGVAGHDPAVKFNPARRLDTRLANPLRQLPQFRNNDRERPPALAQRNLLRGSRVGLPSGQDVARHLGVAPLSADDILTGGVSLLPTDILGGRTNQRTILFNNCLHYATPLWFYILKEAEVQQKGERMGDVGSWILAETFVGLLQLDKEAYLANAPNWQPFVGVPEGMDPTRYTMAHLISYVFDGKPSPLDDPALLRNRA
jgi:hypothetical protein